MQESTDHHRRRAQELRRLSCRADERKKQDALRWLARDHEKLAKRGESADLTLLIRRLHMMDMAEQMLPRSRFAVM